MNTRRSVAHAVRAKRKAERGVSAKLPKIGLVLIVTVLAELFVNIDAVGQLMDADVSALSFETLRVFVVALFLTAVIVMLNFVGGDRAKRLHARATRGVEAAGSCGRADALIAVACPVATALLIATVTYIRYTVGDSTGTIQLTGAAEASATSFSVAEVVLLAAVLTGSALFSYVYSFLTTRPDDVEAERALVCYEQGLARCACELEAEHARRFAGLARQAVDARAESVRCEARDKVAESLLALIDDPSVVPCLPLAGRSADAAPGASPDADRSTVLRTAA